MSNRHREKGAPYKIVRCRYYDTDGTGIYPFCADGGACRFIHPYDKNWPGLEPKPSESSWSYSVSSSARKRFRSPPDRSPLPTGRYTYDTFRGRSPPPKRFKEDHLDQRQERTLEYSPGYHETRDGPPVTGSNSILSGPGRIWTPASPPSHVSMGLRGVEISKEVSEAASKLVKGTGVDKGHSSPIEDRVQDRIRAAWAESAASPPTEETGKVTMLISELTKVHVRLIDTKRTFDDESLKLQAFESLAARFDLPRALASSAVQLSSGLPPFEHPTIRFTPTESVDPRKKLQCSVSQQGETDTSESSAHGEYSGNANGTHAAHQALLETLETIRTRRVALEKRVRDDFEEMASILRKIWVGTLTTKVSTSMIQPLSRDKENGQVVATTRREPEGPAGDAHTEDLLPSKSSSTKHAIDKEHRRSSSRKVEFEDEVGKSHREKYSLRALEDKVGSLEKKLARLHAVEKEVVKLKAELKSQKDEMELVKSTLDVQAKIIANLVDECDNGGVQRDEVMNHDETASAALP